MYFPDSFSGDCTKIHFIGFKGEYTGLRRDEVVSAVYEAKPLPEDHKASDTIGNNSIIF